MLVLESADFNWVVVFSLGSEVVILVESVSEKSIREERTDEQLRDVFKRLPKPIAVPQVHDPMRASA